MSRAQAKTLRQQMTDAERRLWYFLRAHRFANYKFKRQAPIGSYIVDFVCFDRALVLEIDGGQHADRASDARRDDWFRSQGFRVLRFWNNDVLKNTKGVLEVILDTLEASPSPGSRSSSSGGASRRPVGSPPSPTRGEGTPSSRRHS